MERTSFTAHQAACRGCRNIVDDGQLWLRCCAGGHGDHDGEREIERKNITTPAVMQLETNNNNNNNKNNNKNKNNNNNNNNSNNNNNNNNNRGARPPT
jgi:hypothetical protein